MEVTKDEGVQLPRSCELHLGLSFLRLAQEGEEDWPLLWNSLAHVRK
jgi:hypothetical protein